MLPLHTISPVVDLRWGASAIRYMSSEGYGFVWNLPSLGSVSLTENSIQWVSNATEGIDFWVTTIPKPPPGPPPTGPLGSVYAQLLHNYVDVVGHATPMPAWTTGFIQCKDRCKGTI
jgi:alpha-D-xyloside xylohydrolase